MLDKSFIEIFQQNLARAERAGLSKATLAALWKTKIEAGRRGGAHSLISEQTISDIERGVCDHLSFEDSVPLMKALSEAAWPVSGDSLANADEAAFQGRRAAYREMLRAFVGSFSRRFMRCRKDSRLSQDDLAKMCKEAAALGGSETGLQASRISELENGRTEWLTFDDALLLMNVLRDRAHGVRPTREGARFEPISEAQYNQLLDAFIGEKTRALADQVRAAVCHGLDDKEKVAPAQEAATRAMIEQLEAVQPLLTARDVLDQQALDEKCASIYSGIGGRSEVSNNPTCAKAMLKAADRRPAQAEYVLLVPSDELSALVASLEQALPSDDARRESMRRKVRIVEQDVSGLPDFVGHTTIIEERQHGEIRVLNRLRLAGSMDGPVFSVLPASPKHARLLEAYQAFTKERSKSMTLGERIDERAKVAALV